MTVKGHQNHQLRGHNLKLDKKRYSKIQRKHSFTFRIVDIWNSLPSYVVNADNLNIFKRRLDNHWKSQDLVYNYRGKLKFGLHAALPDD